MLRQYDDLNVIFKVYQNYELFLIMYEDSSPNGPVIIETSRIMFGRPFNMDAN